MDAIRDKCAEAKHQRYQSLWWFGRSQAAVQDNRGLHPRSCIPPKYTSVAMPRKGVGCIQTVAGNGYATRLLRALAKSRSLRCNHKMHRNHLVAMLAAAGVEAPAETSSRKRPAETSCRHIKSTRGRSEKRMFSDDIISTSVFAHTPDRRLTWPEQETG